MATQTITAYQLAETTTRRASRIPLLARQQPSSSTPISTPSDLSTFSPAVLSSACSQEAVPVSQTSITTKAVTTGAVATSTATALTTVISSTLSTASTTQTISSGVTTVPTSTTTTYTTVTSTTTIVYASNAPSGEFDVAFPRLSESKLARVELTVIKI